MVYLYIVVKHNLSRLQRERLASLEKHAEESDDPLEEIPTQDSGNPGTVNSLSEVRMIDNLFVSHKIHYLIFLRNFTIVKLTVCQGLRFLYTRSHKINYLIFKQFIFVKLIRLVIRNII